MTEPEGFLSRWSRRKRDTTDAADAPAPPEATDASDARSRAIEDAESGSAASEEKTDEMAPTLPSIDLSKLPPIESITAATDIRAFLAPGVPLELSRAALRRAWVVDPNIRTFIGIAENQWDFTAPDSIPGFGPLQAVDDVRRLVADVFGDISQPVGAEGPAASERVPAASAQAVGEPEESARRAITEGVEPTPREDACPPALTAGPTEDEAPATPASNDELNRGNDAATHRTSVDHVDVIPSRPRRHGRALPEG
jgi:hypothetical protein